MTEENKSKTPIVVGVCFAVAACAAIGLLILRKKPWLKNTKVDNVDNNDNNTDETGTVEISDEKQETEKEEKSSYEKIADAVKPFCSPLPLVRNLKKKVVIKRKNPYRNHDEELQDEPAEDIIVADEQPSLSVDVSEPIVEETEQAESETDFEATVESMKEAETVVEEEKPAMVEPPAVEIPKFTEEQIKSANDFVAEMKKQEPEFNQVFMVPVSEETIETYGFGVGAALLVSSGSDDNGDFTIRAIINRQAMPSEVKVYNNNCKADGFKVFTDMNAAREFATNIMAKATAINSAPESFEESKKVLLQVLLQVLEEENVPEHEHP